jgi:ABC-type branched-subunit amino acid transport system substrate-binding protein
MKSTTFRRHLARALALAAVGGFLLPSQLLAQGKTYGPGVNDTEILIGQTMPYSGNASAYGTVGKTAEAYFEMLNAKGGINGRKIKLLSLDDGFSPPKTVEATRRLIEQDNVFAIFQTIGTAGNSAIHKYLNDRKVPHLFIYSGASKWKDPKNHPWTISGLPTYDTEGRIHARYVLANHPNARIAVLVQNDDFGRDYLGGFKAMLGDKAKAMIVAEATYEVTDPTVDSQMIALKAANADVFVNYSLGKFTVQSIKKLADLAWKPQMILPSTSSSITAFLRPAGPENAVGAVSIAYNINASDPQWADLPEYKTYLAFMAERRAGIDPGDSSNIASYNSAAMLAEIIRRCGDTLTRENLLKQALSLKDYRPPLLLPGLSITTGPEDYDLFPRLRMQRFDGTSWKLFGDVVSR